METAPETTVRIGNVVASILAVTDTVIVFQVPPGAETGRINVTTPIGSATSSSDLTVLPRSTPSIAFASPSSGPTAGGTSVTVKGSGFRPEATVTFGSAVAGGVRVLSDTSLTVLSPFSPSAGSVPVTVTNADGGTATMTGAYSYAAGTGTAIRLIPVVLDVVSNAGATPAHFTTETTLTNSGTSAADLAFTYTASLGAGSGTVFDTLAPGGQLAIPDTIAYLRTRGLSLPTSGSQLGTLAVQFGNISSVDAVAVTARTTTATAVPQPVGAAGLAYSGLLSSDGLTTSATIYGLRQSESDRSNVAVFNTGSDPVTLKVTAFAGDGSADSSVVDPGITLPSGGWRQYTGILGGAGYVNGWATVERTSSTGSFGTYGVINDQTTNDGSYLPPAAGFVKPFLPPAITLPAIVESASFLSEMVVSNRSPSAVTFLLSYTESLTPGDGSLQGTVPLALRPGEQLIIPGAVDFFRRLGVPIGAQGQGSYAGSVRALVLGGILDQVFIGARTAAQSPAGGQYGLFTPGVYAGQEATASAWIYGLRADQDNRSNVAVVNAGQDSDGPVTLSLQVYDAGAGGAAAGTPETKTLNPGKWYQYGNFLASKGVANGWVKVTRMAGSAPWIAYGVVNDGGAPGQRTGDGEYVPMSR